MRYTFVVITFAATLLITDAAGAQFRDSQEPAKPISRIVDLEKPVGLFDFLDPNNMSMKHSYSFTYFTGGGQSGTLGMYNNLMSYKLADPLTLNLNLGVAHQPFISGDGILGTEDAQFMHGAEILYKPNDKFQLNVGYSSTPLFDNYGTYRASRSLFQRLNSDPD